MTTDRDQLREALRQALRFLDTAAGEELMLDAGRAEWLESYGIWFRLGEAAGIDPGTTDEFVDGVLAALATPDQAVMDERERLREAREMLATVTPETKAACYDALTLDAVELGFPSILSALEALAAIRAQGEPK